jgi:HEAT repeat protein
MTNERKQTREVKAGEAAVADRDVITSSSVAQMERATRWMLDLMIARGRDNPELDRQIAQLLQIMGETKVGYLTEEEIKSYGSACTIPIARYIDSCQDPAKESSRQKAIRILSDIGDWYAVDTYLRLLSDSNPSVRQHAAKGLARVTSQDFGRDANFWSGAAPEERQKAVAQWTAWWTKVRSTKVTDDLEKQLERAKKKFDR